MATYTLISSNVLTSSAASVTFSAIPATYTDLVLRMSARDNSSNTYPNVMNLRFNSDSSSLYSTTVVFGQDSSTGSLQRSNRSQIDVEGINTANSTTTTFCNLEIYIPSYLASQSKPISVANVAENAATTAWITDAQAGLYRSNTAISSITFTLSGGESFVTNSSFYLYGISNA